MMRRQLLIGISTAALAAGTAAAQTTTDSNGNLAIEQCSPGNFCEVDNVVAGNDRNRGFARASGGEGDRALIMQRGDDNSSTIEQAAGDENLARHIQQGDDHTSDTDQQGNFNVSYIVQGREDNNATVAQIGKSNGSYIAQGSRVIEYGNGEPQFDMTIIGEDNLAIVSQTGSYLSSFISQGRGGSGSYGSADENEAMVIQTGTGSLSQVAQGSVGNSTTVRMAEGGPSNEANRSYVTQTNDVYASDGEGGLEEGFPGASNTVVSGNVADISIRGIQNKSFLRQNGVENIAIVTMLGGGPGVVQDGQAGPSGRRIPAGDPEGNRSYVQQSGANNFYEISVGGLGGAGNRTDVNQGADNGTGLGTNHRATVFQRGILDKVVVNQTNNSGQMTTTTGTGTGTAMQDDQDGSIADVSQLSFNSRTTINQRGTNTAFVTQGANRTESGGGDNVITITQTDAGDTNASTSGGVFTPGTGNSTTQRNFTEVTQYGIGNTATVQQNAVNGRATVFQRLGSRANTVNIRQGAGGLASGATPADRQSNNLTLTADVTQSGRGSSVTVGQSGQFLSATVSQTSSATTDRSNSVNVSQVADNSIANVSQNGFSLSARIDQRGNGTSANPNRVTVTQSGDGHTATAVQESTSGASGNTGPATATGGNTAAFPRARAAGANSAEIEIMQSGSFSSATTAGTVGNSATVRQQGLGQLGIITQVGRNNVAGILQGSAATNAVAIIEQTGDGNTFFITQTTAGQYMRVMQTGSGNVSTTSASGGTPPGGTGSGDSQPAL
jgi:hypothetical protein